ncbi:hypothetical protein EZJ43_14425 [Pedobacter changchengzhani]|uniref:Glycosyltransferase subfamily 4-like N-terminal domain-containing protein n=2 Tax=Pedobacter changchengzhani TaxID=2529274 RepID=A0A4R5MJG2_9SPHI|nr:hypothetical protein EZJ43_14425 [Pedobacter changchengzhani]
MSLPYFEELGWQAEVITVDQKFTDVVKDELLLNTVPTSIPIHRVKALSKKYTAKVGLGSLALRSLWFIRKKGNELLKTKKFDLIYFSTTEFPVCILGTYWKKKFGIPYVIDMQDPWHTDYYKDKPKAERPKKYWFSYRLNKYLEPLAMKAVDGLIAVSANYIETLEQRYPRLKNKLSAVITFGAFEVDFEIATEYNEQLNLVYKAEKKQVNLVYVGRGGHDLKPALQTLFSAFKKGLKEDPQRFEKISMHFIGTSYAPKGKGEFTVKPVASDFGLTNYVSEYTDRIGFYESIKNLQNADGLMIVGSNQADYTASKLYPYILAKKPLLAVLHSGSSATKILKDCNAGYYIGIGSEEEFAFKTLSNYLEGIKNNLIPATDWEAFKPYTAKAMSEKQVKLFNEVMGFHFLNL